MVCEQTLEEKYPTRGNCYTCLTNANAMASPWKCSCLAHVEAETTVTISGKGMYLTLVEIQIPYALNKL